MPMFLHRNPKAILQKKLGGRLRGRKLEILSKQLREDEELFALLLRLDDNRFPLVAIWIDSPFTYKEVMRKKDFLLLDFYALPREKAGPADVEEWVR